MEFAPPIIGQEEQTTEQRFSEINRRLNELEIIKGKLDFPATKETEKVIEDAVDRFLDDKIFDLIWKNIFHWFTFFESTDGFGTAGTVGIDEDDLLITTGATSGNTANIHKHPSWQGLFTFNRKSRMRTAVVLNSVAAQTIYLTVGDRNVASTNYYGFKIVNATLYGVSYDGVTEKTTSLQTLVTSTNYNLEARYTPHGQIVYFVDATEKGSIQVNLPKPNATTADVRLMLIEVTTDEDVAKSIQVSFFEYLQFRNYLQ